MESAALQKKLLRYPGPDDVPPPETDDKTKGAGNDAQEPIYDMYVTACYWEYCSFLLLAPASGTGSTGTRLPNPYLPCCV